MLKSLASRLSFHTKFVESPLALNAGEFARVCDNAGTISEGAGCVMRVFTTSLCLQPIIRTLPLL
jgi:hypothetical protein